MALLISGFDAILVFSFDNSRKVMDMAGAHALTGGYPAIGYYVLEAAVIALILPVVVLLMISI